MKNQISAFITKHGTKFYLNILHISEILLQNTLVQPTSRGQSLCFILVSDI